VDVKKVEPRILFPEESVASHGGAQSSESKAIAAKPCGNELLFGVFPDKRQAIIGFDDLAEPPMFYLDRRKVFLKNCFQPPKDLFGVLFLARLAILPAENQIIMICSTIDA